MKPSALKRLLSKTICAKEPVLITGAPGTGKSEIVDQATREAENDLIISHPVTSDPTDFKGLGALVDGEARFLPFDQLKALITAQKPTVFFLDDLGQAPPAVQAAAMQLILARRVNGHKVSDHVTFIAATNRKSDRAGVTSILEPVKSRFITIVNLDPDPEDWLAWYLTTGAPIEVAAFIRFRPALLHDFKPTADLTNSPSPRTVFAAARLLSLNLDADLEYETIAGAAGEGFAAELLGFLKIVRQLPSPDAILLDPVNSPVPTDPATLYALSTALAAKASEQNFERICKYGDRLPPEFSVLMVRDSVRHNPDVQQTRAFIAWNSRHSSVMI